MSEFISPEKGIMKDRFKKVIAVKGVAEGAGATFVSMCLALKLGQMTEGVTFAEGKPLRPGEEGAFAVLSTDRKAGQYRWTGLHSDNAGIKSAGSRVNLFRNVNWYVYQDRPEPSEEKTDYRSLPGRYIIVDNMENTEDADIIAALIDPLPSRIFCGFENIKKLAAHGKCPVIWVLNKNNPLVFVREIERFTGLKMDFILEMVPAAEMYRAQYGGTLQNVCCCPEGTEELARFLLT